MGVAAGTFAAVLRLDGKASRGGGVPFSIPCGPLSTPWAGAANSPYHSVEFEL